jgi:hypothetical protein
VPLIYELVEQAGTGNKASLVHLHLNVWEVRGEDAKH